MQGSLKTGFGVFRLPFAFGAIRPDTFAKPAADGTPAVHRYCPTHKTLSNPHWATSPCRSVLDFRLPCCGQVLGCQTVYRAAIALIRCSTGKPTSFPATARRFQAAFSFPIPKINPASRRPTPDTAAADSPPLPALPALTPLALGWR